MRLKPSVLILPVDNQCFLLRLLDYLLGFNHNILLLLEISNVLKRCFLRENWKFVLEDLLFLKLERGYLFELFLFLFAVGFHYLVIGRGLDLGHLGYLVLFGLDFLVR